MLEAAPPGYTVRPHTPADVDAVTALIAAVERDVLGEELITRGDVVAMWAPENKFDFERHSVGVYDAEGLVASAEIYERNSDVNVHPEATGRGLGTWLRRWCEQRARELGRATFNQVVPDQNTAATALLREAGYAAKKTSWILRIEHRERPADAAPPEGVVIRPFREEDARPAYEVIERAFSEWVGRTPTTYEQWRVRTVEHEDFDVAHFLVAQAQGRVVGAAVVTDDRGEMWVDQLAVDRDFRDRGIARALLQTTFQRSFDRGNAMTGLGTDSITGALSLYEKIGMRVRLSFTGYELHL
ncbi:MAG: GNAT family N-acetyltransferase [Hamadaea sp.]|nr:GNAT family N-acetyltransferase [Hamadaea sp.]